MNTFEFLKAELDERDEMGMRNYGVELEPFDGRDTIEDAREEALDLLVYLTKAKQERDELMAVLREVAGASGQNLGTALWARLERILGDA